MSNELKKEGIFISPGGVRSVWMRHDLQKMSLRLKALEEKMAKENLILTESQLKALEKAKEERVAHGEIETEFPGYLGSQDTYYVGTLKGVGRVYQQTFVDTYSRVAFCKLYDWMPQILHKNIIQPMAQLIPVSMGNISLDFKIKRFLYAVKEDKRFREQLWLGAFSLSDLKSLITSNSIHQTSNEVLFNEVICFNEHNDTQHHLDRLSYTYFKTYLHDDILVKVDRASMATSLETRAPFLDVNIMNFIGTIPHKYKMNRLTMKYLLKKMLSKKLPHHILHRPKKGFGIPVAKWFREDLKEMLLDTFSEKKIKQEGYFNYPVIHKMINEHLSGKIDHRKKLWTLFMFELWLNHWGKD